MLSTGQRLLANRLVDVLLGGSTGKIRQFNHQELSVYGIAHQIGLGALVDGYAAYRTHFLPFCF